MNDLKLGNNYEPIDAYFEKADGTVLKRNLGKGERSISNQTLPRIAFQVFEKQIDAMSVEEKAAFPVCRYNPNGALISGIYSSPEDLKMARNNKSYEYLTYSCDDGKQFAIYCWKIFSTILFVRECLKRFGEPGDRFVLTYREKTEKENGKGGKEIIDQIKPPQQVNEHIKRYSSILIESKNIIFHGAPGTGKSYLAKQIAAYIISNGQFYDYTRLQDEQKKQVEFVQFHPSYDYSDFVEGLRPKLNDDNDSVGFKLQDGVFKRFVTDARKNYEDSLKTIPILSARIQKQGSSLTRNISRWEISEQVIICSCWLICFASILKRGTFFTPTQMEQTILPFGLTRVRHLKRTSCRGMI